MTYYRIFQILALWGAVNVGIRVAQHQWDRVALNAGIMAMCLLIMEVERRSSTSPKPTTEATPSGTPGTAGRE